MIPLYNKEDTIGRALESVLRQTQEPRDVIVVNDGSTDGSVRLVKEMMDRHPCLRLINQPNEGVSVARNRGVAESQAPLICFLDADDEWKPSFLENMLELVQKCPSADVYTLRHSRVWADGSARLPAVGLPRGFRGEVPDFIDVYCRGRGLICASTVCIRKSFLDSIGGFPVGKRRGEDIYVWLRAGLEGTVAYHDVIGTVVHTSNHAQKFERRLDVPWYLEYFVPRVKEFPRRQRRQLQRLLARRIAVQCLVAKLSTDGQVDPKFFRLGRELGLRIGIGVRLLSLVPRPLLVMMQEYRAVLRRKEWGHGFD